MSSPNSKSAEDSNEEAEVREEEKEVRASETTFDKKDLEQEPAEKDHKFKEAIKQNVNSRKKKLSQDLCISKSTKSDTSQDVHTKRDCGMPSDLSTESSNRNNESPKIEKPEDNVALVMEHYNAIEEKGVSHRYQSRIVYMRNFNNWIKSMLIDEYINKVRERKKHGTSFKVLDMCCGKGGDFFKWRQANINHLVCVDIADLSIEHCKTRYNEMVKRNSYERNPASLYTAEFINADCTKVRLREKYKDPSIQFDLVSCQFAFHYSFESLPQAECMFKNASESLGSGGYFIGTVPDAYDLVSRWQKSEGNKFGNDVYNVEFQCTDKTKPPLFGAKYNFHLEDVVDCPEFLVHLPTFRKLALNFGLELVMFERFVNYYERNKEQGRGLLGKIQALETYPPFQDSTLLGKDPEDYQHAIQYTQNSTRRHRIGTLSLPEWEATSLYAVFAFQKMRTVWNSKGNPEYVRL